MKDKYTFTKGGLVKRTKSAKLAKVLEAAGWQQETSGGIILPASKPELVIPAAGAEAAAPKAPKAPAKGKAA